VPLKVPDYVLGHSAAELNRLDLQGRIFEPATREAFERAGLASGMRVLDVGSGSGDVALLAAEYVGPAGFVQSVDPSSDRYGVADLTDADIDTLGARLEAELAETGGVLISPVVVGAVGRTS